MPKGVRWAVYDIRGKEIELTERQWEHITKGEYDKGSAQ